METKVIFIRLRIMPGGSGFCLCLHPVFGRGNPLLFKRGNHDHGVGQNEFIAVANRSHNILTLNLEPGTFILSPLTFYLYPFPNQLSS